MSNDNKRDLNADLAVCASATEGPWRVVKYTTLTPYKVYAGDEEIVYDCGYCITSRELARFIAEARTGWPHAIERAIAAEAEVERQYRRYQSYVAAVLPELKNRDSLYAENERLREIITAVQYVIENEDAHVTCNAKGREAFGKLYGEVTAE